MGGWASAPAVSELRPVIRVNDRPGRPTVLIAVGNALVSRLAVSDASVDQPTTRRE
jgi:hypothetical protein